MVKRYKKKKWKNRNQKYVPWIERWMEEYTKKWHRDLEKMIWELPAYSIVISTPGEDEMFKDYLEEHIKNSKTVDSSKT